MSRPAAPDPPRQAPGDERGAAPPAAGLTVEVAVTESADRALLTVRADPPDGARHPEADAGPIARAAAALAAAGVVHGIDDSAVGEAVRSADGQARAVARATPPRPPQDARIVLDHLAAMRGDPLFTVPPGTRIAHRTAAAPGVPGTAVNGAPIEPPEPRVPELLAGPGARLVESGEGIEVHAETAGRPLPAGSRVGIDPVVRAEEIPPAARLSVNGTLRVAGDVGEGARVAATGRIEVGGLVSHAHLEAEDGIAVAGSCLSSTLRAGVHRAACRALAAPLGAALDDLAALDAQLDQLVAGLPAGARAPDEAGALRMLALRHHPELPERWREAADAVALHGADAGLAAGAGEAVAALATLVDELATGGGPTRVQIGALRGPVETERERLDAVPATGSEVRAAYLQGCRVECSGDLMVTGTGTYNTDARVGGDLVADAAGATVRGGELRVAGAVRAGELGAPGGARLDIHLLGPPRPGVRLSARLAHPGVEIDLHGRSVPISHTTLNPAVGCDEENRVARTGERAGG